MGRIRTTRIALVTVAATLLAACTATQPPPRAPLQDAQSLTRAALAATRMGSNMEVRRGADGQVALVAPGTPMATAPVPVARTEPLPAPQPVPQPAPVPQAAAPTPPTVTAQVTIPPVIGQQPPPASAPNQVQIPPSADRSQEVQQTLLAWRLAWELGDYNTYVRFYDPAFKGDAPSRAQWEKQRRSRLTNTRIGVKLDQVRTALVAEDEAEIQFVQHYTSGKHSDVGNKRMKMKRINGAWRITQESWSPRR